MKLSVTLRHATGLLPAPLFAILPAFALASTFTPTIIDTGSPNSYSWGINNAGTVVGWYFLPDWHSSPFSYSGGAVTTLNFNADAPYQAAYGISSDGNIAGSWRMNGETHGVAIVGGSQTDYLYPGGSQTSVYGVNSSGNFTGSDFLFASSFVVISNSLTELMIPDSWRTVAYGINDSNQVVGTVFDHFGTHGFVWDGTS